jgi:hypothetical protein
MYAINFTAIIKYSNTNKICYYYAYVKLMLMQYEKRNHLGVTRVHIPLRKRSQIIYTSVRTRAKHG